MNRLKTVAVFIACIFTAFATAQLAEAKNLKVQKIQVTLGNDEETFTFAGRCPNGDNYRLVSYQLDVLGTNQSFYAYEGPAGKGKVSTSASPKTMSVRVCRQLAEIINQNYWG